MAEDEMDDDGFDSADSEDEDDFEDDEEPLLKYQRLGGGLGNLLDAAKDKVSCMVAHWRFVAIGTLAGEVLVAGIDGKVVKRMRTHRGKVTALNVDLAGETMASCSEDGRAVVYPNVLPSEDGQGQGDQKPSVHNFYHPLKAIHLEPNYSKSREKSFICGGLSGKLVLKKKGWFGLTEQEIHSGEGPISSIAWRGRFIAWANDTGVKIYDYFQQQRIAYIERPLSSRSGTTQASCHMVWENDTVLLLAWADSVRVVRIRERSKKELASDPSALPRCAEMVSLYEFINTEIVCGIAPFGPEYLAVLTFYKVPKEEAAEHEADFEADANGLQRQQRQQMQHQETLSSTKATEGEGDEDDFAYSEDEEYEDFRRPELRILARKDGEEVSIEALPIQGYEQNTELDYSLISSHERLVGVEGKPVLFVVSPVDIVLARPRNLEDHISWALRVENYERALALAEDAESNAQGREATTSSSTSSVPGTVPKGCEEFVHNGLLNYTLRGLQDKLLNFLLAEGQFEKAASLCPRLLDVDSDRWVQWSAKFQSYQTLTILAGFLPIRNPQLPSEVYETVLFEFLEKQNFVGFLEITRRWQTLLYNHTKAQLLLKGVEFPNANSEESKTRMSIKTNASASGQMLNAFSGSSKGMGQELIKIQPLYDVKRVIQQVNAVIDNSYGQVPRVLRDALAELYSVDGQHELALREYLEGSSKDYSDQSRSDYIFSMIERHGLLTSVQDKVDKLVKLDTDRAVHLLVNSIAQGSAPEDSAASASQIFSIVQQLGGRRDGSFVQQADLRPLYKFLHELSTRRGEEYNTEKMAKLQDMQVRLYAKYNPSQLRDFLETASYFSLEEAMKVCNEAKPNPLYGDMVFILGRMGGKENIQHALAIIIEKLRSVQHAIEFVEREGEELWGELVQLCVKDATLVGDLIESVGGRNVDPVKIISHIPNSMKIPNLCEKLLRLLEDIKDQVHLRQGCNKILKGDVVVLLKMLYRRRKRAVHVATTGGQGEARCGICKQQLSKGVTPVRGVGGHTAPKLVVFGSGHSYHFDCIEAAAKMLEPEEVQEVDLNSLKRDQYKHSIVFARKYLEYNS